jgi:thiol-disulfide isomerase/thioredoxin
VLGILGAVLLVLFVSLFFFIRYKSADSLIGKDKGVILTDYSGQSVRFDQFVSGFSRKPLVVYFWATWCPYCNAEFTALTKVKQEYGEHIQILAVNRGESTGDAKQYTDALTSVSGILYLLDSGDALFKKLGGYAMPETIFINSRGDEVFHKHGPITQDEINAAAVQVVK